MAVSFVTAAASGNAVSTIDRTVNLTGLQADDVAVAFFETWSGTVNAPGVTTSPTGFAQKGTDGTQGSSFTSGDGVTRNYVMWKRFASGDLTGGAVTVIFSLPIGNSKYMTLQVLAFRGVKSTGDPWDAYATPVAGTFGSITSMSLTTTDANGALVFGVYNDSNGTHTPPTGFTEPSGVDVDCATCAYKLGSTPGSQSISGASISSSSAAGAWVGALLSTEVSTTSFPISRRPDRGLILR